VQIALTHVGVESDIRLAKNVRGFDAVIGGHDHVEPKDYCRMVGEAPVCQAPAKGLYVGRVDLTLDDSVTTEVSYKLYEVKKKTKKSPRMKKVVKGYIDGVQGIKNQVVGTLDRDLIRKTFNKDISLNVYTADAYKIMAKSDVAFINVGGIRRNLPKGKITMQMVFETYPFNNNLIRFNKIKGNDIYKLVKIGDNLKNNFKHSYVWSGLSYEKNDGKYKIFVDGLPLDRNKTYSLATNSFLATGGDRAQLLVNKKKDDLKIKICDMMAEYIKENSD